MPNWEEIVHRALPRLDKEEIKQALALEWVLARHGIAMAPSSDGRLVGACPFHADDHPSFAVFGERLDRVGCWSCDFSSGDVFDLLQRLHGVTFRDSLRLAGALLDDFRADEAWSPSSSAAPKAKADPAELSAAAAAAAALARIDGTAIRRCVEEKGWSFDPDWLRESWGVGVEDDYTIVVPHWAQHDDGVQWVVKGLKTRTPRSHLYARAGSDLQELYGAWRDRGLPRVVLCEGESDAWTAAWALGDGADVLALPTGANTPPRPGWVERLSGRHVVLAFDGDAAGRTATRAFHAALSGRAASVLVASLPDGKDLSAVDDPLECVNQAIGVPPDNGAVTAAGHEYQRLNANGAVALSNWVLMPERELVLDDGSVAYEGLMLPHMRDEIILSRDLANERTAHEWSATRRAAWSGTTKDARHLLSHLQAQGPFLGRGRATGVVGWHEANFVWPGGRIGPDYWVWLPGASPTGDVQQLVKHLNIAAGSFDPAAIDALLRLHSPGVMTPILAWMAVAPLRPVFDRFPPLAVTGSSGSGKTTLIGAVLDAFGWRLETTLTSTTPWAVSGFCGGSNGIPVWFDEYRAGARDDTLARLEQALRDAWAGQDSFKGGMGNDVNAINAVPALAPIIVTGEDAFSETSHVERLALVNLPRGGRSADALRDLADADTAGLSHAYLEWLVWSYRAGRLPSLSVDHAAGRVEGNLATLAVGWWLLQQFAIEVAGYVVPDPDWSHVVACIAKARSTDPIIDALSWGTRTTYRDGFALVLRDGDDALVRLEELMIEVERSRQFKLPGRKEAIRNYLLDAWSAAETRHDFHGRVLRLPDAWNRIA